MGGVLGGEGGDGLGGDEGGGGVGGGGEGGGGDGGGLGGERARDRGSCRRAAPGTPRHQYVIP